MVVAPDGRAFVSEQCGTLRVVKNDTLLAAPALTVSTECDGERGLLGVAVDPNFSSNQRIFVYYTVPGGAAHNRVSRFTLAGDVVSGGEQVVFELPDLNGNLYHNGGALHFGADGSLYVSVGDNTVPSNAQTLGNLFGKVLRINADGSIPVDNPFYATATGQNRAIWAFGLRNPYSFAIQPGTGRMFINDVGENSTEEIDDGIAGSNYGWPTCEGPCSPTNPSFRDPISSYGHAAGCAITGGTFFNPSTTGFPGSYLGKYFYADYCGGWINLFDPASASASGFATGLSFPVDVEVSPSGGLYYLQRGLSNNAGQLWRIEGTATHAPIVTQQPAGILVSVGQSATFTVAAGGDPPLSYQWQRDGTDIPGETATSLTLASAALADSGATFRAVVTNPFGSVPSQAATLAVTTNLPPNATITSPVAGTPYQGGQTISYAATADDPETGALPASAYTWEVVFHHDTHTHPFMPPTSGVTSGTFVIPTIGETSANVYYAILLTVKDGLGLSRTVERDVMPRTATMTFQATPVGAQVTLDGQPMTTPATVVGVTGVQRTLGVVSPQSVGGAAYLFSAWSDGGAATHAIATPAVNTTYSATYVAAPPPATNVTFVRANANTVFGGSSLAVSLSGNTSAGNLLVVGVDWEVANLVSLTDGQGNTFTQIGTDGLTPNGTKARLYYARNIRGGAETVTVTMSGSDPVLQLYVAEYAGADLTNPLDVTVKSSGSGSAVSSGAVVTTTANDQLVAFCVSNGTCSTGSGYTARSTHSGNLLEDRVAATPGSYTATATSNSGWAMILAAFRPQGGIVVPPAPVASVTVTPATASVGTGKTVQLTATPRDGSGAALTGRVVTWGTSDATRATVSGTGLVTGVAAGGPVTITATSEGQSGTAAVTVTAPIPVTAAVTAANKTYDGTTTATITGCTLSGSPAGVTCSAAAASFADVAVGTGKTVTATGITLGGANAALYALTATTATTTADIIAAPPPPPPTGNVTFVQANANSVFGGAVLSVPLSSNTAAGNLLVVGVDWELANFVSLADGQGNAFIRIGTDVVTPAGTKTRLYYARNIRGGAETVTVTMSGNDPVLQLYVAEYAGADITNPLDVSAQASGPSGSVSSGPLVTTTTNDQLVAFCVSNGTCSTGSGYTARSTHSGNLLEDRTAATTGSYTATATSSSGWAMVLAALRPQGGVVVPPAPVASVSVTPATAGVGIGKTVQLTATPRDASGTALTGRVVTWSTGDATVATVSGTGLVTGVAAGGPVTITAASEGQVGTATVTVTAPIPVTAAVTAANKVFDGTTTATITSCTLSGSPAGVTCGAAAASFADAAVGTGKTVTATGITLGGVNAALYALTSTTATTIADINPPPACSYSLASSSRTVSLSGGAFSVGLTTTTGCAWTSTSNAAWVTITSGASGTGNGTVRYSVAANTGPLRVGTMSIADKTFTVTQSSGCSITIAPTSVTVPVAGGSGNVAVTASGGACAWTAVSNRTWITVTSGASGTGSGSVGYTVAPRVGGSRSGTITIGGKAFTVRQ
jgi:glucose/arabinose dehydrogenase/uncharacterized protein YjdB